MMSAILYSFANPSCAVRVGLGALQKPTVSPKDIVHAILSCSVEF